MYKYMATGLIAALGFLAPLSGAQEQVISLYDLVEKVDLDEFFQHKWDDSIILKVPSGISIPFAAIIQGDLAELRPEGEGRWVLDVKKTFYVRHLRDKGIVFSLDRKKWKPLSELVTGQMDAGFSSDKYGPLFTLKLIGKIRR